MLSNFQPQTLLKVFVLQWNISNASSQLYVNLQSAEVEAMKFSTHAGRQAGRGRVVVTLSARSTLSS